MGKKKVGKFVIGFSLFLFPFLLGFCFLCIFFLPNLRVRVGHAQIFFG